MAVDALAREFIRFGHSVVVLAPYPRYPLKVDDARLPYAVVRHPRFYSKRWLVRWYRWHLIRLHRAWAFDVLHCHDIYPPGYLAALSRSRLRVPVVITSHDWSMSEGNWRLAKPYLYPRHINALATADALVAISEVAAEGYKRLCPEARFVRSIPNGVDLETLRVPEPRPEGLDPGIRPGEYFLFIGRLKYRKGVDLLLDAFANTSPGNSTKLIIAGEGDKKATLRAHSERLCLGDRVRFVGWVSGALKTYLLQNTLCTVIPSRGSEGFPLVTLECYAAGRPVIASSVPGLRELVTNQTGILVKPESSRCLAQALHEMLANTDKTFKLGACARTFAQDYGWPAVARRHLELYEMLLAQRSEKSPHL